MKGNITPRGKNTWRLRYDGPPDGNGQRKQISETVHGGRKDAQRVLRERLAAVESGNYIAKNRETVAQFMQSWLDGYASTHTSPRTLMGYKGNVTRYIIPCLGGLLVPKLTARDVQTLHKWMLEKGLSNQTVVHAHRVLSEALKHAVAWGIIPKNPAESVSPPRPEAKGVQVPAMDAITRFFEAAQDSPFLNAFKLALYTGMRRSELTGLRWDDVDFITNTLRVTGTLQRVTGKGLVDGQPKSKASRRAIDLGKAAVDLLHSIRGKQLAIQMELGDLYQNPAGYVFTDSLGNPMDSNRLSREFHRIAREAGLSNISLHTLRHLHASQLIADGGSIKLVAERLGHANAALTLNVYSHLLPGLQRQAAEALDKRLSQWLEGHKPDTNQL